AVRQRIERASTGKAQLAHAGTSRQFTNQSEKALLIDALERGRDVPMALREVGRWIARGTENLDQGWREDCSDVGAAVLPRHVDAFGKMPEVPQVEPKGAVRKCRDEPTQIRAEPWLTVRGESHHLVLVTEVGEAQELRYRRVEEAERVREVHSLEDVDPMVVADCQHGGHEVAESIDGEAHRALER